MCGVEQVKPVELGGAARAQPRIEHRGQTFEADRCEVCGVRCGVRCAVCGVRCEV